MGHDGLTHPTERGHQIPLPPKGAEKRRPFGLKTRSYTTNSHAKLDTGPLFLRAPVCLKMKPLLCRASSHLFSLKPKKMDSCGAPPLFGGGKHAQRLQIFLHPLSDHFFSKPQRAGVAFWRTAAHGKTTDLEAFLFCTNFERS